MIRLHYTNVSSDCRCEYRYTSGDTFYNQNTPQIIIQALQHLAPFLYCQNCLWAKHSLDRTRLRTDITRHNWFLLCPTNTVFAKRTLGEKQIFAPIKMLPSHHTRCKPLILEQLWSSLIWHFSNDPRNLGTQRAKKPLYLCKCPRGAWHLTTIFLAVQCSNVTTWPFSCRDSRQKAG